MVVISKKEKDIISERYPDVYIVRTMSQHSERHRYYCEEAKRVMRLLDSMRNPNQKQKEGTNYRSNKKRGRVSS